MSEVSIIDLRPNFDPKSFFLVQSGDVDSNKLTLFSIFKNEIFFCEAFFDWYRKIGVEQFVILDDGSNDGTKEFLLAQPDCILLSSPLSYGQVVRFIDPLGDERVDRATTLFKMYMPSTLLNNCFVVMVDADEFIFLPQGYLSIKDLIKDLAVNGIASVCGSVLEFFPASIEDMNIHASPRSFRDLLWLYPFFQARPVITVEKGRYPVFLSESRTMELFRTHGISRKYRYLPLFLKRIFNLDVFGTARSKMPIFKLGERRFLSTPHRFSLPPTSERLLVVAHFVFTCDSMRKARDAVRWNAHAGGSEKYKSFCAAISRQRAMGRESLLTEDSVRFESVEQFEKYGLMVWPRF